MIRMEGQNGGQQCWIPTNTDNGARDAKPNIQVQYNTNTTQSMYNTPCSVYNVPTITLPPTPNQTYILDTQPNHQPIQPNLFQAKQEFLKCSHWPNCKFYTSSSTSLKNHELTHFAQQTLHTCTDCNIHFTTKAAKDEHIRRKHKTWAKVYSCSHCHYETSLLDEFSEHNVAYHLESGTCGQIYQCHQCNYSTSWKCFMDSHMLIHSINDLDYRANKKPKFDQYNSKDPPVTKQEQVPLRTSPTTNNKIAPSPNMPAQNRTQNIRSTHNVSAQPVTQMSQQNNMVFSQTNSPQTTLANIAPMPQPHNTILTQLTTLTPQQTNFKQEYRCNMCHHFVTTCPATLHQHIKSHNTCQECGYSTNNITDLSLHVCHSYDGQNTYTNAILNSGDNNPPMNFGAINPNYGGPANSSPYPMNSPPRQKKRPGRSTVDDDFQQNVYRCRKCEYVTSWKCFLDSHMLTHAGIN